MKLLMLGGDAGRAVAVLIACHARIASIHVDREGDRLAGRPHARGYADGD
jgi:hypothetical protein